jgi:8-oxo-dGTP pyrophosphatase MutT (NUDIX family)
MTRSSSFEDNRTPTNSPEQAISAGGVVYRKVGDSIEIVLVSRRRERLWALPKGTPNAGESTEETALREVREETGLEIEILEALGELRYTFINRAGVRVDKVVHHFLMEPTGGSFDDHDDEFDDVDWYDLHEAQRRLTHRNQIHILDRAAELIAMRKPNH